MQNVYKKWFAITLASLTVSACAPIKIKDYEMYGDMGRFGATKVHTLFTEIPPVRIYQPEWDNLRIGMVCTTANNIADIQATIDKLCTESKKCDYEKLEKARSAMRSLLIQQRRAGMEVSQEILETFKKKN